MNNTNEGAEMQRRHAKPTRPGRQDLAGFEPLPAPPFYTRLVPAVILWGGFTSILLGLLYLMQGATFPGFLFVIIGALFAKAAHEA